MQHDVSITQRLEAVRTHFVARTVEWIPEFAKLLECLNSGRPTPRLQTDLLARSHQISGTAGTLGFSAVGTAAANLHHELDQASNSRTGTDRKPGLVSALEAFLNAANELPDVSVEFSSAPHASGVDGVTRAADTAERAPCAHIMIVEDDALLRDMMIETLAFKGWEFTEAGNGLEAILALFKFSGAAQGEKPDLIILDVDMPVMDGFEALKLIQASPAWQNVPVVMLTARADEVNKLRGLFKGAQEYITKPFDVLSLSSKIDGLLAESRAQRKVQAGEKLI